MQNDLERKILKNKIFAMASNAWIEYILNTLAIAKRCAIFTISSTDGLVVMFVAFKAHVWVQIPVT